MNIRRPTEEDVPEIERIASKYPFEFPTRFHHAAIVENDEKIIAFGILRTILEGIAVLDGTKREAAEALKELVAKSVIDASNLGFEEIYVYSKNEDFAKIMERHFEFEKVPGVMLVRKVKSYGQ